MSVLPKLTSLDISSNELEDASKWMNLNALHDLRRLNVSDNPRLTPVLSTKTSTFSWWKILSEHPSLKDHAEFVGLANVGLTPDNVRLWKSSTFDGNNVGHATNELTCPQLRWIHRVSSSMTNLQQQQQKMMINGLDLSRNSHFLMFTTWYSGLTADFGLDEPKLNTRDIMECNCKSGPNCTFVDEALLFLIKEFVPSCTWIAADSVFQPDVINFADLVSIMLSSKELLTIHLTNNGFNASIPSEIGDLPNLKFLILYRNKFKGPIPDSISKLHKLQNLQLWGNKLNSSIPQSITRLTNLNTLNLAHNKLTGNISYDIGMLEKLRILDLGYNQLSGPIPQSITKLTRLENLELQHNKLTGNISYDIGVLEKLQILDLEYNQLSGPIPQSITKLTRLETLRLQRNKLTGTLPEGIGAMVNLRTISLEKNRDMKYPIPQSITKLTNLVRFSFPTNDIDDMFAENLPDTLGFACRKHPREWEWDIKYCK